MLAFSCAKKDTEPVLSMDNSTAPALTSPGAGEFLLFEDNAADNFATFTWSAASYALPNLPNVSYSLEMDAADNAFASAMILINQNGVEISYTVAEMNQLLLTKGFVADQAADVAFRVIASVSNDSSADDLISATTTLTVTPYSADVYVSPIYIVGGATDIGWTPADALPFSHIKDGTFGIVTNLKAADEWKLISVLGDWAPMWGTDAAGTVDGGNLVYRPTEDDDDPPAMKSPAVEGIYRIVADTVGLTYEVFPANANLYMLGDATAAGWDNANAIELTNDGNGVFSATATLTGGGALKFIEVLGQWAPQWGAADGTSGYKGSISWRLTEADPDPASIVVPSDGTYEIIVDIAAQKFKLTPQ